MERSGGTYNAFAAIKLIKTYINSSERISKAGPSQASRVVVRHIVDLAVRALEYKSESC